MQTFDRRPFVGSPDFMGLFTSDAPWTEAASGIHVFELDGEWLSRDATDDQVHQVVADLNRRGIAIALSGGALALGDCSGDVEGFAGIPEGVRIARRIRDAGGTAYFYAFDHPYDAGTGDLTPERCRMSPEEVALQIGTFETSIREVFPDIIFGDDITAHLDVDEIARWVETYRTVIGEDLGFEHLDVDYAIPNWVGRVVEIQGFLQSVGIDFGMFYLGTGNAPPMRPGSPPRENE